MKKFTKAAVAFILFFFLFQLFSTGTYAAGEETDPYYEKVIQNGELVVGLSADYAPNEFHATVNGKDEIVGSDISLAKKIAKDLGVKLTIKELGFDALLGAMKTGKIDVIISGMSPTPERLQEVNFTDNYSDVRQTVVVRKKDKEKFKTLDDFDGVKVGAQKQSTQEELAKNEIPGSTVVSLQKVTDLILNLKNGKVDAIVVEGPVGEAYISQNPDLAMTKIRFEDGEMHQAIALPKEAPALEEKLNASIAEVREKNLMKYYLAEAGSHMVEHESFLAKYGSYYLKGAGYTIFVAFIGVLFGCILGCLLALMKLSTNFLFKWIAIVYIEYVKGTPLLVQVFLVYFGTAVVGMNMSALIAGCIALALNSAAYVAEIIRAGIQAVDNGQLEAARSLGMSYNKAMYHVVLPQAVKNILPALGNEFVTVIKESSIVSVIGVSELMFQAGVVQGASFKPFLPIVFVSLIYFVLTFTISRLLGVAERRLGVSD